MNGVKKKMRTDYDSRRGPCSSIYCSMTQVPPVLNRMGVEIAGGLEESLKLNSRGVAINRRGW